MDSKFEKAEHFQNKLFMWNCCPLFFCSTVHFGLKIELNKQIELDQFLLNTTKQLPLIVNVDLMNHEKLTTSKTGAQLYETCAALQKSVFGRWLQMQLAVRLFTQHM